MRLLLSARFENKFFFSFFSFFVYFFASSTQLTQISGAWARSVFCSRRVVFAVVFAVLSLLLLLFFFYIFYLVGRTKEKALELWQLCPFLSKKGATDVAGHVFCVSCGRERERVKECKGEREQEICVVLHLARRLQMRSS